MDGHFGVTPPISPGSVTEADVNAGYAISCGPEQSPLGGPTHGLTSGGRTPHPPGRLTPKPTSYGAQYRPVGVMETQAEVHVDGDIDAVRRELDNELETVRSQIRTLSMTRKQRVRADINRALSDHFSDDSDMITGTHPTCQQPRTASVRGGGDRNVDIPATEHQVQASSVVFRVCLMPLARGDIWGRVRCRIL